MNKDYVKIMIKMYFEKNSELDHYTKSAILYLAKKYFPDKNAIIADIGIGFGQCSIPLKDAGYKHIIGVDIDDFEKKRLEKKGIKFLRANLEKDKIPIRNNSVDVVISMHVIEHIYNFNNYMSEIYRILKKGGLFVCVTPDYRKQFKIFYFDPTHVKPYDKIGLKRLFSMYNYQYISCSSFGAFTGTGLLRLYVLCPRLLFSGQQILCIGRK